jgi:Rrf2 family transcriptional regulator, cysteine metabolism repressor
MKISTKGRYGLRAMLDLAIYSSGEHISLLSIANRQDVSVNYLEQVFSILRKAGLVISVKGAQGGYMLASPPSKIRVGDILRCLEGNLCVVDEETEKGNEPTPIQQCIAHNVWEKINGSINEVVDSITLDDLANDYNGMNQYPMFYI